MLIILEMDDVLLQYFQVVEVSDREVETIRIEAVYRDELLLLLPEGLENHIDQKTAVKVLQVQSEEVKQVCRCSSFLICVDPIEG